MAITKSDLANAMRCEKRAWLFKNAKENAEPATPGDLARMLTGQKIGKLARELFPVGYHIQIPAYNHEQAVSETEKAISDSKHVLFEAAFQFEELRIRVDILSRLNPGWEIIEVKSSNYDSNKPVIKPEHLFDVAFQVVVARKSGLEVPNCALLLLNKQYTYDGIQVNIQELFTKVDVTEKVEEIILDCQGRIENLIQLISQSDEPEVPIGLQCKNPTCEFLKYCSYGGVPKDHLMNLPYASRYYADLWRDGVHNISQIPPDAKLDKRSLLTARAHKLQSQIIEPELKDFLNSFRFPLAYLDFEAIQPAIPIYKGTSPYQTIPFQFSLHLRHEDGKIEHFEFLHSDETDPRLDLIARLHPLIMQSNTIVTYSDYEKSRLKELSEQFGGIAEEMFTHFSDREQDLCRALRSFVGDPEFAGSYSIKTVLPVFVPELSYDNLTINNGELASLRYFEMIDPNTSQSQKDEIRRALLEYCKLDTVAMVRLHEALLTKVSP